MKHTDTAVKSAPKKAGQLVSAASTTNIVVAVKADSIQQNETQDQYGPLATKEKALLAECKTDIHKNLQGWFVVGYRLWQIREQRLYRDDKKTTFEEFCNREWDFSKAHANRVIQAYQCANHLKSIADVKVCVPSQPSQVRCIAGLSAEDQVKVAKEVYETVGEKDASAADFQAAKNKYFPPKEKPAADDSKEAAPVTVAEPVTFDAKLVPFVSQGEDADSDKSLAATKPVLMSWSDLHELIVQTYDDYTSSQDDKVRVGFRTLKVESKKWADWQLKPLKALEVA